MAILIQTRAVKADQTNIDAVIPVLVTPSVYTSVCTRWQNRAHLVVKALCTLLTVN